MKRNLDAELAKIVGGFNEDPLGYVMFNFPWDTNPDIQIVELVEPWASRYGCKYGPDKWACEFLDDLGAEIKKRGFGGAIKSADPIKFATASGHGIGKSVLVAWLIKFIFDCWPRSKGVVTAGKADQLKTKTWAELGKWHKMSLTERFAIYNSSRGSMNLVHKQDENWRCDAQTCKEENADSFAGLHAAGSIPYYIFDEASAVPDKIYEVREGGTTDGMPIVADFGNPTQNTGYFYENCEGKFKHRYKVRRIDSRDVEITNKELFRQWIEDYGIDSDFVKVRVLGQFPSSGSVQFIPSDVVKEAMAREPMSNEEMMTAPLIISVDVARFGDDESVIKSNLGRDYRSYPAKRFRGLDTVQLTGKVIETIREFRSLGLEPSAIFIDGGGIGGGVFDQLFHAGYDVTEVQFGAKPTDTQTYRYTSDEIWGKLKDELKRNLILPELNTPEGTALFDQLTQRHFGYTLQGDKIHLETKKDMKARLGSNGGSPDIADAYAISRFREVEPRNFIVIRQKQQAQHEYDPLDNPD